MDQLLESLWHGPPILGDRELKYDGHSKKCGYYFGKTMKSWKVDLTCGAGIPLLSAIALISLAHILQTANPGYGISNWRDDKSPNISGWSQLVFQKWKGPGYLYPDSKNI